VGAPKAITAMARKLACLFYRLIKHEQPYVDTGTEYYEGRYREQQIRSLTKRRKSLAFNWLFPRLRGTSDARFLESGGAAMRLHTKEELCSGSPPVAL
jgi:hypothetical protein